MGKTLASLMLAASIALASCGNLTGSGGDNSNPSSPVVTGYGDITGRVDSTSVANNQIIHSPMPSAYVHLINGPEMTTNSSGLYYFQNVQAGNWIVEAKKNKFQIFSTPYDSKNIPIFNGLLIIADDLVLITTPVLRGIVRNQNGTPFSNKTLIMHPKINVSPPGTYQCVTNYSSTTTTSSNGDYVFAREFQGLGGDVDRFCLQSPNATQIIFQETGSNSVYVPFAYDIATKDATAQ